MQIKKSFISPWRAKLLQRCGLSISKTCFLIEWLTLPFCIICRKLSRWSFNTINMPKKSPWKWSFKIETRISEVNNLFDEEVRERLFTWAARKPGLFTVQTLNSKIKWVQNTLFYQAGETEVDRADRKSGDTVYFLYHRWAFLSVICDSSTWFSSIFIRC